MSTGSHSTKFQSKEQAENDAQWLIVDVAGKPVGRAASQIASWLRGKHKTLFTKHVNGGDFVVVINAEKITFTGKKLEQKRYYDYSGYIGGLRDRTAGEVLEQSPETIIERAVKGMLPRGALGHRIIKKLKIYKGTEHPHAAQKPQVMEVK